jgi:hypothetical protein
MLMPALIFFAQESFCYSGPNPHIHVDFKTDFEEWHWILMGKSVDCF